MWVKLLCSFWQQGNLFYHFYFWIPYFTFYLFFSILKKVWLSKEMFEKLSQTTFLSVSAVKQNFFLVLCEIL